MKKTFDNLKVAVYYDWLNQWGGAERVLLSILKLFPQADLFSLFSDQKNTPWLPKSHRLTTSFLQSLPQTPLLSPFYDLAAESFDFSGYDLIISTTTNVGHCLITPANSLFVCYYHNLNRHLYLKPPHLLKPLLNLYQSIDKIYSRRPDYAFTNSQTVNDRLQKYFHLKSTVIHPGIDTNYFRPSSSPSNDYFLIVSRLVPHKRLDYAIETFKSLPYQLKIIGFGRDLLRLKKIANHSPNISFLGQVNQSKLLTYYQNCTALICPQLEDFGLTALEAQSCGRPVIGFKLGGNQETIIHHQTGILYPQQSVNSLTTAINNFFQLKISAQNCRQQALGFSQQTFMLNFKKQLTRLWSQKINTS